MIDLLTSGFLSLCIPLLVIILAIVTKRIIPSLFVGILIGGFLLSKWNLIKGVIFSTELIVSQVANKDNVYIILFLFLFGSLGDIMKVSGGIKGFAELGNRYIKTEKGALLSVWLVSPVTFIDCCFHGISTGTIGKALINKVNGSKRKLAFIVNVTSCLLIILIPFGTTYIGYIVGVIGSSLKKAGIQKSAYSLYLQSIPFNLYAIIMLLISFGVIFFGLGFDRKLSSAISKKQTEKGEHGGHEAHEESEFEELAPPKPLNLIIPLALLILSTAFFFWYTGKNKGNGFMQAIMNAEFEKAILISSIITIVLSTIFYLIQKIPMKAIESNFLSGGTEMLPPIIVLILSWSLSSILEKMGFVKFVTTIVGPNIPHFLIPASIFLIGCASSYFMGSAWGTWALIMPLAVPLAVSANVSLPLIIGSVLAGGSLGDNASPLGETAILSSTICEIPLMEHVKSQLPYSLTAIGISTILFIVIPFFF